MIRFPRLHERKIAFSFFIFALFVRIIFFATISNNLRYPPSSTLGSAAIGYYFGKGCTLNDKECSRINEISNNYTGNYLDFFSEENREPLIKYLPGPAVLLAALWKLFPFYNFFPYILFQAIVDSILIGSFYLIFKNFNICISFITSILMALNLAVIKRTLEMGYDFFPIAVTLFTFIGILYELKNKGNLLHLFSIGFITGLTFWFRATTVYLPIFIILLLIFYYRHIIKLNYRLIFKKILAYLIPILLSIILLSMYRYNTTGSYRPTRSTFWHTFFLGVGQFENPYGIGPNDLDVWNMGKELNMDLKGFTLGEMYKTPDSIYEQTLKNEATHFISVYPQIFIRNIFYRVGIMISPFWYRSGDFIPSSLFSLLLPIGAIAFVLWFLGMYYLFKNQKLIFWLSLAIYLYFFAAFGWFAVVGRVILTFLFMNIFVYQFGIKHFFELIKVRTQASK